MFSWALPASPFMIMPIDDVTIFPSRSDGEACSTSGSKKLRRDADFVGSDVNSTSSFTKTSSTKTLSRRDVSKRALKYGPLIPRIDGLMCPGEVDLDDIPSCDACEGGDSDSLQKRDDEACWIDPYRSSEETCPVESSNTRRASRARSALEPRTTKAPTKWEHNGGEIELAFPSYKSCAAAMAVSVIQRWYGYPKQQPAASACEAKLEKLNANEVDTSVTVS
ncbi:hypothetical protein EDB81DRAFT_95945 [Dactylonectria macrodidyma]|uniref:Uncharacterized protein n=1 Tax=Dactylonectria macrodidyma TaxID=307937 RepID=A0A9P9EBX8_9HYPO|nr:hypothetical protein EDB81DRAFT_95945 [Dactylonectria macrodidyma]